MEEVFDPLRKKYVALTPEENVRQQFIRYLNEKRLWPLHMMASETEISIGEVKLRCDIVCYGKDLSPKMIVECKRPTVKISSRTFEQIWNYALILKVEYIVATNGKETFACRYDGEKKQYVFIGDIPAYAEEKKEETMTGGNDIFLKDKIFRVISETAAEHGVRAFVIGGFVRDCFLQRPRNDIDVVVEGSGIEIAQAVGEKVHSKVSVFKNFGTAMLRNNGVEIEFVGARKESYNRNSRKPIVEDGTLEDDQKRRDFTVNALAFSLQKEDYGNLVDPFGGVADLQKGLLRTPLDPDITYSDDPLRMIRAIRFATQLNFTIVPESIESIKRNKGRLEILSRERIAEEMNKILLAPKPSIGLNLLQQTGLLEEFLPQLSALQGVETMEGRGHKENFAHTLQVLDNVAEQSDNLWLRWAALLHDIGKPATKRYESGAGWTFHGHEVVGARMVPGIFKQMKMPLNEKMKYVQKLVALHLRPIALVEDAVTDSAVRRLLFDAGDDIDDLMILCNADITSKNEAKVRRLKSNFQLVRQKLVEVEEKDAIRNFKNPITGELVMEYYGIEPCNLIGQIKEYVKEAILDGKIENNFEQAFELMKEKGAELGLVHKEK
ncbi:MAG: type I restriction enzyme HsdR N-terminal domain-containing protein [Bacteroidales bacterium]|nr:type I restriction enzyme HsdR N-terminal domain-containing protein [Bacteroidales bacterium]